MSRSRGPLGSQSHRPSESSRARSSSPSDAQSPTHLLSGAHEFSIGSAQMAGRDLHVHYGKEEDVASNMTAVVSWLASDNYRLYHDTTSSLRTAKTGLWFLESNEFQEWLSSAQGVLWVTGMPGAGKTVLASHSVDYLIANVVPAGTTNAVLTYVYCRYLDNCKAGYILRSLLRQLVEDHRHAYSIVRAVFEDHKLRQVQLTDSRAADLLGSILRLFDKAFVIIDGLDEVPESEKSKVLVHMKKLPANRLIFSRPMTFFMDLLPSVTLSIEARNADIETFVLDRINHHPRLQRLLQHSETLVQEVTSRIQRKASGMFLVAALQVEALTASINVNALFSALESLPSGVNEMYDWTMKRINDQKDEEATLAKRALTWIVHARHTLTVEVLELALATFWEEGGYDESNITPAEIVVSFCCGLVTVDHNVVRLIHYSTQEYLQEIALPPFSEPAAMLASSYLAFISSLIKCGRDFKPSEIYFLRLAVGEWSHWAKEAVESDTGVARLSAALNKYATQQDCERCSARECELRWWRGNRTYTWLAQRRIGTWHTPFQLAACSNLPELFSTVARVDDLHPTTGFTSLHFAVWHFDAPLIKILLDKTPFIDVNARDKRGATPLLLAVQLLGLGEHDDNTVLDLLLAHPEVDVNQGDAFGRGPIFGALEKDDPCDLIRTLLSHPKINPNALDIYGITPLMILCGSANEMYCLNGLQGKSNPRLDGLAWFDVIRAFLSHPDIDVNVAVEDGLAPLFIASLRGDVAAVQALLAHPNININAQSADGFTSLSWATSSKWMTLNRLPHPLATYPDMLFQPDELWTRRRREVDIAILSRADLDPNLACDNARRTPLMIAVFRAYHGAVARLLRLRDQDKGEAICGEDSSFAGAVVPILRNSIHGSTTYLRQWWLRTGQALAAPAFDLDGGNRAPVRMDINAHDTDGRTALFWAKDQSIVRLILAHPEVNINHQDIDGKTALIHACEEANLPVVQALLVRDDISLNCRDARGIGALTAAALCTWGHPSRVVELLVRHPNPANVNMTDALGRTALHWSVESAKYRPSRKVSRVLLSLPHLDINLCDKMGDAPIHLAHNAGVPGTLFDLLQRSDIDVNLRNGRGKACIHLLVEHSDLSGLSSLLRLPSLDVNSLDNMGDGAIHIAAKTGDFNALRALLQHPNIDVNLQNAGGYSAIHLASRLSPERGDCLVSAILLHPHIDVNRRDRDGCAPVDILSRYSTSVALRRLLCHSELEDNALDHRRSFYSSCWRIIHASKAVSGTRQAKADRRRVRDFLIYDPACIYFTDSSGKTVLHHAAMKGSEELVATIMASLSSRHIDVDVHLHDKANMSPVKYAENTGHRLIRDHLLVFPWFTLFDYV